MQPSSDQLVGYFGFGSLVNKHTLRTDYHDIVKASLMGWRRHWQARTITIDENAALLSIHRDPGCTIKGMLVVDLIENLPLVDEREEGYSRHKLSADDLELPDGFEPPQELYVYVGNEAQDVVDDGVLLQSYLDAVLQGFHQEYGEEGLQHFVETTAKFNRPLIADRNSPIYPRGVELASGQQQLFDQVLATAGVLF